MPNTITANQELVTTAELAREYRTSKVSVIKWLNQGTIPAACRAGRVIRFDRAAVAAALATSNGKASK